MKKNLITIAVLAAAFSAPAFAETSHVNVYGKLNVDVESVSNNTAAVSRITRMQSNASRLGVNGKEDLGDGISAIWQLEAQFDAAGNGATGPFNSTRNSRVGLASESIGTLFFGNWDTPFKVAHNPVEQFDNSTAFTATKIMGRTANAAATVDYNTRQSNVIQYWTPKVEGFSGQVSYSSDATQTTTTNKTKLSLAGTYENDALYGALAYETRPDQTVAGVTDSAARLVGAYKVTDQAKVGLTYEHLVAGVAAATSGAQNNWELSGTYTVGHHNLGAFYAHNGNFNNTVATGAHMSTVRYGYGFSKRTELFAAYTVLSNQANASYNINGGGAGSRQTGLGLGMIHSF